VFTIESNPAPAVLTGLFWDPFDGAHAITTLIRDGFSECETDAIAVLCGRAPDLTDLLFSMGIERGKAIFYNHCFANGAILLIVRTEAGRRARIALNTLRRHGGIVLAAKNHAKTHDAALPAAEREVVS
jgi:hypothetical protein